MEQEERCPADRGWCWDPYVTYRSTQCTESEICLSDRELVRKKNRNSASQNSLERLVEADGGGAVEDDVDVLYQDTLIVFAQIQLRLCEVTVHGDDLLRKARLLLLQSFEELKWRGRQSCSSMRAKRGQTPRDHC